MKPFDLEEAKAGAPICTRDGHSARIICWDKKSSLFPIVAAIDYGNREAIVSYTITGEYKLEMSDDCDLFMVEEEHYDVSNFKPFDKVLVRDCDDERWQASFFSHYETDEGMPFQDPFITVNTRVHDSYCQCIPYNEETAHLVGIIGMPPKKYINWL